MDEIIIPHYPIRVCNTMKKVSYPKNIITATLAPPYIKTRTYIACQPYCLGDVGY